MRWRITFRGLGIAVMAMLPVIALAAQPVRTSGDHGVADRDLGPALRSHRRLLASLDSIFSGLSRTDGPGCAVGVLRGGQTILARGYGMADIERGVAITPATVFDVGSVTKQFTALAVLLLARDSLVSLDDDVRRHLPELAVRDPAVRVWHLLSHTSGIPDYLDVLLRSGHTDAAFVTQDTALTAIRRLGATEFTPGERWSYSNSGYVLLAEIIQRTSGVTFGRFVTERVLAPLGMTASVIMDDYTQVIPGRASGYQPRLYGGYARVDSHHQQVGDGGLFTSLADLARWASNFRMAIVGEPDLLRLMTTEVTLPGNRGTGYGFGVNVGTLGGEPLVWHAGAGGGFRSTFLLMPRADLAVACLCNSGTAPAESLARSVVQLVQATLPGRVTPAAVRD